MKKYFITGLVILLPVTLTLIVITFLFNLLTEPFLGVTKAFLDRYDLGEQGFLFLNAEQLQRYLSQVFILITLLAFTIVLGMLARWFFVPYVIRFWELVIDRIPFVSSVYKACQDVIKTIFGSQTSAFKQVVMVPFPNKETQTIGLVTRESLEGLEQITGETLVVVFVPTTPNPTSGFLTIFKKKDIVVLDIPIEDAFKYVISCGVIMPPFKKKGMVQEVVIPLEAAEG